MWPRPVTSELSCLRQKNSKFKAILSYKTPLVSKRVGGIKAAGVPQWQCVCLSCPEWGEILSIAKGGKKEKEGERMERQQWGGEGMEEKKGKGKEEHPVKRLLIKPKRQRMHNLFLLSYPALSQCVSYVCLLRVILQVL